MPSSAGFVGPRRTSVDAGSRRCHGRLPPGACGPPAPAARCCVSHGPPPSPSSRFQDADERPAAADVAVEALCAPARRSGCGFFSRSATVAMMKPGVQKPHISASSSQNACCTGCSVVAVRQAVDGANLLALRLRWRASSRRRRFGRRRSSCRRRSAAIAAALVAGEVGAVAHRIEQRDARLDPQIEALAVHRQRHRHVARADDPCAGCASASATPAAVTAARPSRRPTSGSLAADCRWGE